MFKKILCIIAGVMLVFTFSFGETNASTTKSKTVTAKNSKIITTKKVVKKPATTKKAPAVKAKVMPKKITVKPTPKPTLKPTPKPQPKDINKEIINTLSTYLNTDMFSGYALVSRNDSVIFEKGFGKADFKKEIEHSSKMKYGIASITKQFTSFAILQLEEKNALKVEDYINKYLPNFPYGDKITIHQLLTHTSGLPDQPFDFDITAYRPLNNKEPNKANDDKIKLVSEPGTSFLYSNSGYILLGYIIEKTSGKTLDAYFKENIMEPFDLKNTGFNNEKNNLDNMAMGYLNKDKEEFGVTLTDTSVGYVRGASGLYSTVEDLLKWETALTEQKFISKKFYEKMYNPYDYQCGYGWFINSEPKNAPSYFHYGVSGGYRTYVYRRPSDKLTIIIISNYGDYDMSFIASMLVDAAN